MSGPDLTGVEEFKYDVHNGCDRFDGSRYFFACNRTMVLLADYAGIKEMATGGAFINKFLNCRHHVIYVFSELRAMCFRRSTFTMFSSDCSHNFPVSVVGMG